jgi:hypothetical protein
VRAVVVAALLAGACVELPPGEPLAELDVATFAAEVQPVLDERCAAPSCHGRPERPLAIYSPRRYRREPARRFLDEPLDADELAANARGVASFGFAIDDGLEDSLVLRKPLALAAGGARHEGGEIFVARDERDYRTLYRGLAAGAAPPPPPPADDEGGAW